MCAIVRMMKINKILKCRSPIAIKHSSNLYIAITGLIKYIRIQPRGLAY